MIEVLGRDRNGLEREQQQQQQQQQLQRQLLANAVVGICLLSLLCPLVMLLNLKRAKKKQQPMHASS